VRKSPCGPILPAPQLEPEFFASSARALLYLPESVAKQWRPALVAACLALPGVAVWADEAPSAEPPALRSSEPQPRRQPGRAHADERLSEALSAAKAAWPGMMEGSKRESENYNTALARIVAAMQERRFREGEVRDPTARSVSRLSARAQTNSTPRCRI
jgi:hypothetical protein